jgi:ribulose-5-phosphate 4-epimerase/fuculose-1-phosphate aldolase
MNDMAPSFTVRQRPSQFTQEEWGLRVELAAAYRLTALNGWGDGIANHISARIPGEGSFLLNPFGVLFSEITASNLVKIDSDGNILCESEYRINPTGFVIHSAVYEARPDVGCVIHLHTDESIAVACLDEGLLPLNQTAMLICDQIAYHDYEGVSVDRAERARLGVNLGQRNFMILRNHGPLTVGAAIGPAFCRMAALQRACAIQVMTLSMGRPIRSFAAEARTRTSEFGETVTHTLSWAAFRRELDRVTTDYMT